MYVTNNRRLL